MIFLKLEYLTTLIGFAVFFIVVLIAVLKDKHDRENDAFENKNEWLFSNWTTKVYKSITKTEPAEFGKKIGIDVVKYTKSCRILNLYPDIEDLIVKKITGLLILIFFGGLMLITKNYIFCGICMVAGAALSLFSGNKINNDADKKKAQLEAELPRFLDLLQTALYINLPIENAIMITAKSMDTSVLAKEFLSTMADVQLGASSWQDALIYMADKYELEELTDLVTDLNISYQKGLSIYDAVRRKSETIKQAHVLKIKERATKFNSTLIFPIVIFDLIPMLAIILIPIIIQLNENGLF